MKSSDLHKLVRTVAKVAGGFLAKVTHSTVAETNSYGEPTRWADPVVREALIIRKEGLKVRPDGKEVATHTEITFPRGVVVQTTDRLKWATDGLTATESWPIAAVESPLDSAGQPYMTRVWLGFQDEE